MTLVVRLEKVCKRFGGVVVADHVDLEMRAGEILGLIGPNGAGKTSLFNLISGIVQPDSGRIELHGRPIQTFHLSDRARAGIARTWQNMRLFASMSVMDNLLVGSREYPAESVIRLLLAGREVRQHEAAMRERALETLGRMRLERLAKQPVAGLPFGQQKLIGLARALMNDGDCLLLDEPMAGVEGEAYDTIRTLVREEAQRGRAVCVVEHNVTFVRDLCSSAVFMANGRILERGSVSDLLASETLAELYFGT